MKKHKRKKISPEQKEIVFVGERTVEERRKEGR